MFTDRHSTGSPERHCTRLQLPLPWSKVYPSSGVRVGCFGGTMHYIAPTSFGGQEGSWMGRRHDRHRDFHPSEQDLY